MSKKLPFQIGLIASILLFFALTWPFRFFIAEHYLHQKFELQFKAQNKRWKSEFGRYQHEYEFLKAHTLFWDQIPLSSNADSFLASSIPLEKIHEIKKYDHWNPSFFDLSKEGEWEKLLVSYGALNKNIKESDKRETIHHFIQMIYSSQNYDYQLMAIRLWKKMVTQGHSTLNLDLLNMLENHLVKTHDGLDLRLDKKIWDEVITWRIGFCSRIKSQLRMWMEVGRFFHEWEYQKNQIEQALGKAKSQCYPSQLSLDPPRSLKFPWSLIVKTEDLSQLDPAARRIYGYLNITPDP